MATFTFRRQPSMIRFITPGISISLATLCIAACSLENYHDEARRLTDEIYDFLPSLGVCASKQECQKEDRVLFAEWGSVHISIYGISEPEKISAINKMIEEAIKGSPNVPYLIRYYKNRNQSEDNEVIFRLKTGRRGNMCDVSAASHGQLAGPVVR